MTTEREPSPWSCTACGQRVQLADAREHYDRCTGGDRDNRTNQPTKEI